jgi:hypothetical protein
MHVNLIISVNSFKEYSDIVDDSEIVNVEFPFLDTSEDHTHFSNHPSVKLLREKLSLDNLCGYITLIKKPSTFNAKPKKPQSRESPVEADMLSPTNDIEADRVSTISFRSSLSSTVTKDPRKIKTNKIRLANEEKFEDFEVFDCVFGIPLFDEQLNERICEKLASKELLSHNK